MHRTVNTILIATLAIAFLILIGPSIYRIPYRFSITYNEGWNVYHSDRAIKGEMLYDPNRELTPLIYPPLFFYVEGIMGKLAGDFLLTGRVLAILSLLACGILCGLIGKALGASIAGVAFGSFFFMASVAAFAPQYIGMNDPQLLGHTVSMIALLYLFRWQGQRLFVIAALLAISLFIKHNLIAVPIAIGLELLLRSRKQFGLWLLAFACSLLVLTAVTFFFAGDGFLDQIFSGRFSSLQKMLRDGRSFITIMIAPLFFTVLWLRSSFQNPNERVIAFWFLGSVVIGTIGASGFGTAVNMYFDAFLSLAVIGSLLLTKKPHWAFAFLFSISILWTAIKEFPEIRGVKLKMQNREKKFLEDVHFVKNFDGRIACSNLLLCFSAGKPLEFDPFNVSQRIITGKMQEAKVVHLFESGYFQMVQIKEQRYHPETRTTRIPEMFDDSFFTVNTIAAVRKKYKVVRKTDVGTYYLFNSSL